MNDTSRESIEKLLSAEKNDDWRVAAVEMIKTLQNEVAAIERQFDSRTQSISVEMKFKGEADLERFQNWKIGAGKAAGAKLTQIRLLESALNTSEEEVSRAIIHSDLLIEIAREADLAGVQSQRLSELFDKLDRFWPRWRMIVAD